MPALAPSGSVLAAGDEPKSGQSEKAPASQAAELEGVDALKHEAEALEGFAKSPFVKKFLAAVERLPRVSNRRLYVHSEKRVAIAESAYRKLDAEAQKAYVERPSSETLHYYTRYGSPLAYSRVLEVLAEHGQGDLTGRRLMDFGYGTVGHLRLLAECGVDAVGVDVDSFLTALYSDPADQGVVKAPDGKRGSVTLVEGRWPSEKGVIDAVGGGYDIITSKNTLKNGYLHPEREVDKRMLLDLGVSDEDFVKRLYESLKPGGLVVIYNICPAPAPKDKPFIPWADGRCPFSKELWEKSGFKVLAYDVDDSAATRKMGHLLGWDEGPNSMDLKDDLFAHYTIVQKTK